jgi:hypothetical protein
MNGSPESGTGEGAFKARAGALTLLYLTSSLKRSVLLPLLAEAATGVRLIDELEIPDPEDPVDIDAFIDPYLVEPADPELEPDAPIGPDTMLQPTPAGKEVPFVALVLQQWLDHSPGGPILVGPEAGPVLWALLGGWSSTVVHAFAAGPRTIPEACEAIQVLDMEMVEAQTAAMEEEGLLDVVSEDVDGEERFAPTEWLRRSIAPLAVAARMELRHPPGDTAPIAALDVQAAFHLTLPLLELPPDLSGSCSLAVELDEGVLHGPSGVTVRVEGGRVVSCESRLEEDVDAWASASAPDWLEMVIEAEPKGARSGGDRRLAAGLIHQLHKALFGATVR